MRLERVSRMLIECHGLEWKDATWSHRAVRGRQPSPHRDTTLRCQSHSDAIASRRN